LFNKEAEALFSQAVGEVGADLSSQAAVVGAAHLAAAGAAEHLLEEAAVPSQLVAVVQLRLAVAVPSQLVAVVQLRLAVAVPSQLVAVVQPFSGVVEVAEA
jgi:hypothetical protein